MIHLKPIFIGAALLLPALSLAQLPGDAILMGKGEACLALSYTHEAWDHYWEGGLKRQNGNIGTLTRQSITPMLALGLRPGLNLLAALPWVRTHASGGQMAGISGFQDWSLWLKWQALRRKAGGGELSGLLTLGASGPASNYLSDYMPFSLGLGCLDVSGRATAQYSLSQGPYVRASGAFHWRGGTTIERYYYYTTQGIYSDRVDVPHALSYAAALGSWMLRRQLRAELLFDGLETLGGFDIRRQDMGFPSNKMIFSRIGVNAQYYPGGAGGLGFLLSGSRVLSGRNVGQSSALSAGLTWQFQAWQ
jgi:hypothetical protein